MAFSSHAPYKPADYLSVGLFLMACIVRIIWLRFGVSMMTLHF